MSKQFTVVFETAIYYSVVVNAEDADEAATKALENKPPATEIPLPLGYELNDRWFVEDVSRIRDED